MARRRDADAGNTGGMRIHIGTLALEDKAVSTFFNDLFRTKDTYRWNKITEYQLEILNLEELHKLEQYLTKNQKMDRSFAGALKDVQTWIFLKEHPNQVGLQKPRSISSFADLLTNYILTSSTRHLYEKTDEGSLPYLITSVAYEPGDKDTKAHVTIYGIASRRGFACRESWTFYRENTTGGNVQELLGAANLYLDNPVMRMDYDYDCELYNAYKAPIGRQFLAKGVANTDDLDGNQRWDSDFVPPYYLDHNGVPTKVVIDVADEKGHVGRSQINVERIGDLRLQSKEDSVDLDMDEPQEVPLHPYLVCFDLAKHNRISVHVRNLEPYVYDKTITDKLILPEDQRHIIDILTNKTAYKFNDVIGTKGGGRIIIAQGKPGVGKTLTAEIVAEATERPLYTIQCSQLGTTPDTLEKALVKCLARGSRWDAIILLDEADVYVQARGESLLKNAIIGVFLRVLEYHTSTLFLTTNRGDAIDDAILSRSLALIRYEEPEEELRYKIWAMLLKENNIELTHEEIEELAIFKLCGRDIKNMLKLCLVMGQHPTSDLIESLLKFRPGVTHGSKSKRK